VGDHRGGLGRLRDPRGLRGHRRRGRHPAGRRRLHPRGDRVSLIATLEAPGTTTTEPDGTVTEEPGEVRTQYLLQSIEVLAIGQRTTQAEGEAAPQGSVLMTVALQPEDAERLVFAIENASLYFTLLPEDAEPQDTPGRTLEDLFS
jgi:Flp pilus assembly protein CpaB